jgi:Protein of unknown function (DUF2802)
MHEMNALWGQLLRYADTSTLLALASLSWFTAGAAALWAARRTLRRLARRLSLLEQLANSTSMDLKTLLREGVRFQDDSAELLSAIALLNERQDQLELRTSGGAAYEHAIDLARNGLSPEQLMRSVGLTRGEAELLAYLHRDEPAAAA